MLSNNAELSFYLIRECSDLISLCFHLIPALTFSNVPKFEVRGSRNTLMKYKKKNNLKQDLNKT